MSLILIAALTEQYGIGKDNDLLVKISEDLKNFKRLTSGNTIVMGRKTYESIGRPLPKRNNIVISRSMEPADGLDVCRTIDAALEKAESYGKDVFIIGGGTIYDQTIGRADTMYLSWVKGTHEADTFFPKFSENEWHVADKKEFDEFTFVTYHRK